MLVGPQDTPYESGIYKAKLLFPTEFPSQPPEMIFQQDMWHPNGARLETRIGGGVYVS